MKLPDMHIMPILRGLRHSKTGATLIALQIALTLAIVANCVFIMQSYRNDIQVQSGMDEANIFSFGNEWATDSGDIEPRIQEDLAVLRALPGVRDAEATGGFPLCGCGGGLYFLEVKTAAADKYHQTNIRTYLVDDHGLDTYGLHLVSGRWFTQTEVGRTRFTNPDIPAAMVVSRQLADKLFPSGNALGQWVHVIHDKPSRIVGIVELAVSTYLDGFHEGDAAFVSLQYVNNPVNYVVRTWPGAQTQVIKSAPQALYGLTRERVIRNIRPFTETRRLAAQEKHANTVMLAVICAVLVTVTVFGIIGLTQFWVTRRRRYIGMRRALGARRIDILKYFHTENLLISGAGCVLGVALGLAGNVWMLTHLYGLARMGPTYIGVGALMVFGLSQFSVLWPALRAASLPPAIAARRL